jgi:hypothetical protein
METLQIDNTVRVWESVGPVPSIRGGVLGILPGSARRRTFGRLSHVPRGRDVIAPAQQEASKSMPVAVLRGWPAASTEKEKISVGDGDIRWGTGSGGVKLLWAAEAEVVDRLQRIDRR